jgi:hypothetical protein
MTLGASWVFRRLLAFDFHDGGAPPGVQSPGRVKMGLARPRGMTHWTRRVE